MEAAAGLILMVLTGCGEMSDGKPTGVWLEEFSVPYELFTEAGYAVHIASPEGGEVPVDPRSTTESTMPENGEEAIKLLQKSKPLASVELDAYDAVFFPGGHGTMFDLPESAPVAETVRSFLFSNRPIALVCHGPAALVGVTDDQGQSVVQGRKVTGFTDSEERAVQLDQDVPFLLQTRLEELGASFDAGPDFQPNTVVDGNLITGQNPASSAGAAKALLKNL